MGSTSLCYYVEGMDCASCAQKIKNAVELLPGAQKVSVHFAAQSLVVNLDEQKTPRSRLERDLSSLGYTVRPHGTPAPAERPWYRTIKGINVINGGVLVVLAYAFHLLGLDKEHFGFLVATLFLLWPVLTQAWRRRQLDPFGMHTLVSVAGIGALIIHAYSEAAVVVWLFAVGELLETIAAGRARQGIQALANLVPKTAELIENNQTYTVPVEALTLGQEVQVRAGEAISTDGTIISGQSEVDESALTGESVPVFRKVGDLVYAGSINRNGVLLIRVDQVAAENTIAKMYQLVLEAEQNKSQTARFIDRFSQIYTPLVLGIALAITLVPLLFGGSFQVWFYKALTLLLIACPCALVLSVPAAITSGLSVGARRGLLIKGGAALETLAAVRTIAFDKTGTLTVGQLQVTDVIGSDASNFVAQNAATVLQLAASLEHTSQHPIAQAVVNYANSAQPEAIEFSPVGDCREVAGEGVYGTIAERVLRLVSPHHAQIQDPTVSALEAAGKTVVVLQEQQAQSDAYITLGYLALRDELRPEAADMVKHLRQQGIESHMLTGDNSRTAQALADILGIQVHAQLKPADKLKHIQQLRKNSNGKVAMIGDGINDAPALAEADIGISLKGASDIALETAQMALLKPNLNGIPAALALSKDVMQNIQQNIVLALGLKAIFLVATLLGWSNLWMAIVADTGATVLVTANALRLLAWKYQEYGIKDIEAKVSQT